MPVWQIVGLREQEKKQSVAAIAAKKNNLYLWEIVGLGVLGFGFSEGDITPFVFSIFIIEIFPSRYLWT